MKLWKPVGVGGVSVSMVREVFWVDGIRERLVDKNGQWVGLTECRMQRGAVI